MDILYLVDRLENNKPVVAVAPGEPDHPERDRHSSYYRAGCVPRSPTK